MIRLNKPYFDQESFTFKSRRFLVLDNDVTTFNTEHLHAESVVEVGRKFGFPVKKDTFWETVGIGYEETYEIIAKASGIDSEILPMALWCRETRRYFEEHADTVTPCDDTMAVIEQALNLSMPIAIVSSSPFLVVDRCIDVLRRRLRTQRQVVDLIVTADDVPKDRKKPDPYPFQLAMEQGARLFNAKPETAIVLEDSVNGVTSAVKAGLLTIARPMKFPRETETRFQERQQELADAGAHLCLTDFRGILGY